MYIIWRNVSWIKNSSSMLLFFDDLFGWQWILFQGLGMLEFWCIKVFNAVYEILLLLFLLDGYQKKRKRSNSFNSETKIKIFWKINYLDWTKIDQYKPSLSGNGFFSWVCACFNFVASNPSIPWIKFCCDFSVATSKSKQNNIPLVMHFVSRIYCFYKPSAVGRTIFSWVTVSLSLSGVKPSNWLLRSTATFGKSSNFGADIFLSENVNKHTKKHSFIRLFDRNKCEIGEFIQLLNRDCIIHIDRRIFFEVIVI